jgi:beta-lactamase regulating signal transducer with metallopeptidase domain
VCIGLLAPRIAVSRSLLEPGRRAMLEHVLLHEFGHVRRRDPLQSLAWTLARCAYWFHPLVHMGARRAALVRELACDEIAARESSEGHAAYRRTLIEMARALVAPSAALSAFSGGQIIARIERLSRPPRATSRAGRAAGGALFVMLCACCIPLGRGAASRPSTPAIDDLEGCLRKRFAVMAEIERRGGLDKALQSP